MKVENIAAVLVTAEISPLPARRRAASTSIASSIGDARSLQGGTLLPTPLRGPDGEVVALAQGPLSIGGFGGGGGGIERAGESPDGRTHSRRRDRRSPRRSMPLPTGGTLTFALREPDFVTASRVAQAINTHLGALAAQRHRSRQRHARRCPTQFKESVPELMAQLEDAADRRPTSSRASSSTSAPAPSSSAATCSSAPAAVAHGNLSVRITTRYQVSQPAPFSQRRDRRRPQSAGGRARRARPSS